MRCRPRNLAVVDPFRALRSEFSKQVGMPTEGKQGGRVTESDTEVVLAFDLPGVDLNSVEITVVDGLMSITGARCPVKFEGGRSLFADSTFGEFQRSFRLHKSLDSGSIDAVMDLGVLTVTIPKRLEEQAKTVAIRSGATA